MVVGSSGEVRAVRDATASSIAVRARTPFVVAAVAAAVALALTVGLALTPSSTYAVLPGQVTRLDGAVVGVSNPPVRHGGVAMVDVVLAQLSRLAAIAQAVHPTEVTVSASDLGLSSGAGLADYAAADRRLLATSMVAARTAATRELERRFGVTIPGSASVAPRGVGGPSAGLAASLALCDRALGGALSVGRLVVATGTISPDGAVGPVGGVAAKAGAVRRSHAALLLVPASEVALVRGRTGSTTVVGVTNLDAAVVVLLTRR